MVGIVTLVSVASGCCPFVVDWVSSSFEDEQAKAQLSSRLAARERVWRGDSKRKLMRFNLRETGLWHEPGAHSMQTPPGRHFLAISAQFFAQPTPENAKTLARAAPTWHP